MLDLLRAQPSSPIDDAKAHLSDAFAALSLDVERIDMGTGVETPVYSIETCVSEELEWMDRAIRATSETPTMLHAIAADIRRAHQEIYLAIQALNRLGAAQ